MLWAFLLPLRHPLKRKLIFAKSVHTHYCLGFLYHAVLARIPLALCFTICCPESQSCFLTFVFPLYLLCALSTRKSKAARPYPAWQSIFLCLRMNALCLGSWLLLILKILPGRRPKGPLDEVVFPILHALFVLKMPGEEGGGECNMWFIMIFINITWVIFLHYILLKEERIVWHC